MDDEVATVSVTDTPALASPNPSPPTTPPPPAEGLLIVESLATHWGVANTDDPPAKDGAMVQTRGRSSQRPTLAVASVRDRAPQHGGVVVDDVDAGSGPSARFHEGATNTTVIRDPRGRSPRCGTLHVRYARTRGPSRPRRAGAGVPALRVVASAGRLSGVWSPRKTSSRWRSKHSSWRCAASILSEACRSTAFATPHGARLDPSPLPRPRMGVEGAQTSPRDHRRGAPCRRTPDVDPGTRSPSSSRTCPLRSASPSSNSSRPRKAVHARNMTCVRCAARRRRRIDRRPHRSPTIRPSNTSRPTVWPLHFRPGTLLTPRRAAERARPLLLRGASPERSRGALRGQPDADLALAGGIALRRLLGHPR